MPRVVKETKDTRADPKLLPNHDITGRQRAPQRRQRDAARRGQAMVDGHGAINETVLVCRAAARLAAQDRAARARGGAGRSQPRQILWRWGSFLVQTGRGHLTVAQARSVRRRSTRDELLSLAWYEKRMIGWTGLARK